MLVLTRKNQERILIGDNIVVTVVRASDGRVRLGFEAPANIRIHREEVYNRIQEHGETKDATTHGR